MDRHLEAAASPPAPGRWLFSPTRGTLRCVRAAWAAPREANESFHAMESAKIPFLHETEQVPDLISV